MKCYVSPYEGDQDFLFFSYCHDDEADVYPIIERLALEGFRVWYDDGIHPGDDWPDIIAEHLSKAKICMAAISKASVESHNCRNEVSFAVANNKPITAVILQDFPMPMGIRLQLSSSNFIRKYEHPEEAFYEKLINSPAASSCRNHEVHASADQLKQWQEHAQEYLNYKAVSSDEPVKATDSSWFQKKETRHPEKEARKKDLEDAARRAAEEYRFKEERRRKEAEEAARKAEELRLAQEAEERRLEEERRRKEAEEAARKAEELHLAQEAEERRREEERRLEEKRSRVQEKDEEVLTIFQEDDEETSFEDEDGTTIENTAVPAILFRVKTGEVYPVLNEKNTIGRSDTAADLIVKGNQGISREHADILKEGDEFFLHQITKNNFTEVNGEKVEWDQTVPLSECSEIMLGTGQNREQFFLLCGSACDHILDEQKLCMLKSRDSGEIKLVNDSIFPLDRHHQWKQNVLGDPRISREKHAIIYRSNGKLFLRDTGSKTGTFCNGKRLDVNESAELHHGDMISIVHTRFDYYEFELAKENEK